MDAVVISCVSSVSSGRSSSCSLSSPHIVVGTMTTRSRADCVRSAILTSINLAVCCCSVSIIVFLLIPITFKKTSLVHNPSGRSPPNDTLALAMTVNQYSNYFTNVPGVHLNMSEEEMNELWFLPPGTRLSPLMQDVARCRKAVDGFNRVNDLDKPVEICNQVPVEWPWVTMIVAAINVVDIVCHHLKRVIKMERDKAAAWVIDGWAVWFHMVTLAVAGLTFLLPTSHRENHIGMTYTPPGDFYPKAFFPEIPTQWNDVLILISVNGSLKLIECAIICCIFFRERRKQGVYKRCWKKIVPSKTVSHVQNQPQLDDVTKEPLVDVDLSSPSWPSSNFKEKKDLNCV